MAKTTNHTYARYTSVAIMLLATLIREARQEKKIPAQELAGSGRHIAWVVTAH